MAATFVAARADVKAVLDDVLTDGFTAYGFTPGVSTVGTVASVDWDASSSMTEWTIPVRVFARASLPSVEDAQTNAAGIVDDLEAAFDRASLTATWTNSYLPDLDLLVSEWLVTVPREDF